jgi:two-component system sensor histidine kinase KdpD
MGFWLLGVAACTAFLWAVRDRAHEAHMALAYLLLVLGGSARHGRWVGLVLAVASFLTFNLFLLPPYYTFAIEDPLDWWVLVAFLVTGLVSAQLFHRTQSALESAETRAREVERLGALGAQSLSVPRAVDAVAAIARVIRSELPVASAGIVMLDAGTGDSLLTVEAPEPGDDVPAPAIHAAAREGRIVLLHRDGSERVADAGAGLTPLLAGGATWVAALVPLRVRERNLGVLRLADPGGLRLDHAQAVFADTLSYYAALAVERVRLTAEAEHVEALREADRLKDALLASVSHDLRTPLTTIRALASELRETGDERSAVIEEEAERLNRLVTDLLDLSRIRGGALPLEPQVIAAEDLVGAMLQRLGGVPGAERVEVRLPSDGSLPVGRFDFVHALRALGNLVENALRHSPEGGEVRLDVREERDELVFAVLDRGPGVPAADRERMFEPFFHSGDGGRAGDGTGLGLAIARDVAEAQGGSVRYRPRPGGGSEFELRLPRETIEGLG